MLIITEVCYPTVNCTEAFSRRQFAASSVAKVLSEKQLFPTWESPLECHNNWGTHFTGEIL